MQAITATNATTDKQAVPSQRPAAWPAQPGRSQRYGFVDLLRGFALVVMIETHVVNAYLPVSSRNTSFFFWLSFVNGLVAPAFLFASGFSIMLQARRQGDDWLHFGPAFRRQTRRIGFILLVAYYMHLPHFGLSKFLVAQDQAFWKKALQVDVLQCIVVSLLAVNVLILVTRSQRAFVWAAAAAGVIAALVAPSMWARDFSGRMPLSLALFLNPHGASLFPLFPWISFVLAGSCAAHLFLNAVDKKKDARHMRRAFIGGLIAIAGSMAAREWTLFSAWNTDFYRTSPLYVLIRLGCVLMVGAALYYLESRWKWAPHTIRLAGQESLLVYTLHLMLIFSILRGTVTASVLGKEAGYPVCFLMSAVIIVLMLWLAGVWHKLKKDHARFAKRGLIALVALNALIFLLR